jgi:hypothetical protein
MLSVYMCARFQAVPKDCHLRAVKTIMRYLVLTPNLGLWYPKGSHFELNSLDDLLSLGIQRNKIMLPYPRSKRSMSPLVVVVHNYFGCEKLSMIMVTL